MAPHFLFHVSVTRQPSRTSPRAVVQTGVVVRTQLEFGEGYGLRLCIVPAPIRFARFRATLPPENTQ